MKLYGCLIFVAALCRNARLRETSRAPIRRTESRTHLMPDLTKEFVMPARTLATRSRMLAEASRIPAKTSKTL